MKVTLLQMDIAWAQPEANVAKAEALIRLSPGADLYVLPEMWATGFVVAPEGIAEEERQSIALQWMKDTARQRQCAISGSLAVRVDDGSYRNRHYFVTPGEDEPQYYDKRHLFAHGHEDQHYQRGTDPVVVTWKGARLLLQTCYDLRFPVFSRYGRAGTYDAIVYVANWPAKRQPAWDILTRARAIENQCYVVAVNRVGIDPVCEYGGGSVVAGPIGHALSVCNSEEQTLDVVLDLGKLESQRQHFRVLDDRDEP